ncbi:hypothetical protein BD289DRAFT_444769 [Coniella lustricola]|uniref:GST N-terminal domain-containing protein n=1 Tax=Coniella lustricola TaxID=2025994 RepID=A0A2T2ZVI2_9PEZI|nr:hypothetical protein BD289DRAFT_444769 [Coniella lustricola]
MSQQITLFDLANQQGTCWSLNPWKTRFVLNFKGLDYKTEWLEYPNIKPRLEPHLPGLEAYTSPTIVYSDGRYVADSRAIAELLEREHPSPSLHLDAPVLKKLEGLVAELMPKIRVVYMPVVYKRILHQDQANIDYWVATRTKRAGMTLDEMEKKEGGTVWQEAAEPYLRQVTELLKENDKGPFFLGDTVSYADFVWAGLLIFVRRVGDDFFQPLLDRTGDRKAHEDLLKAVEPWSKRDDH